MSLYTLYQILKATDSKIKTQKFRKLAAQNGLSAELIEQIEAAWYFVQLSETEQKRFLKQLEAKGVDADTSSARMMIRLHRAFLYDDLARHLIPNRKNREQFFDQLDEITHAAKIQLSAVTPIHSYESLDDVAKAEELGRLFMRIFDLRDLHLPTVIQGLATLWSLSGQLATSTKNEELRIALASLIAAINGHAKATQLTLDGMEVEQNLVEAIVKNIRDYYKLMADLGSS
jgi:hypothetical protein